MGKKMKWIVWVVVALGITGITYTLFTEPVTLLTQIGLTILFIALFFLIFRFFSQGGIGTGRMEQKAYKRAVKQSKERHPQAQNIHRFKQREHLVSTKKQRPGLRTRKKVTHLTVIEGKKGKKKNRALF